jgi:tRNA-Thr(GGU) m(6)t(6)A37 methyltransferase TsaA
MLAPAARAKLRIRASVVQPAAALDGLSGFSHVWLVYDFHENTNAGKSAETIKAKVHPPGLGGGKIGLFATRTPHRPNPIGLTCARLLAVEGDTLVLGGADLIHGTPVLDIKPYLRHDIQADAHVPAWCEKRSDASLISEVRFSEPATAQLDEAMRTRRLRFYTDVPTARAAIEQMLQLDIRSVHQGRGKAADGAAGQAYSCRLDELKIEFTTHESHVLVTQCMARTNGVDPLHYPQLRH